jgi:hypothetical protein
MSTKISKKTFKELLRKLIQREIEEVSTTANVPGYETPNAFSGKGKDRRDSVASGSGYEKIDEADDHEGKMAKAQLERSMEYAEMIYKMIGNVDTDGDGEVNFPSWVQSYLTKSQDYLQSVYNYLDGKDGLDDKFQKEDITSSGYSQLRKPAQSIAISLKDLLKGLRSQNDDMVLPEIEYIHEKATEMMKMMKNKRYNESVNEAVLTISYQPIFDADKKDKLEKIAKKSGLAIRSRGKQGFTVDGKRANVEKFIKATRGMIEVKESVNETLPNRVWMDLRKKYSTNELKRFFKEGLPTKTTDKFKKLKDEPETDAGKDFGIHHKGSMGADKMGRLAEPDTYDWDDDDREVGGYQKEKDKKKKGYEPVKEDAKDVARAKKITRDLEKIEGKYRKSMYDLSDRLQADPKNHKLQDELVKSYTKNVTSFMRDMIKITKRMK